MPLSLDDVMNAPTDPDLLNKHLQNLGYLQPPPAPAPVSVAPMSAVPPAPSPVAPMKPLTSRGADMAASATSQPDQFNAGNPEELNAAAPEIGGAAPSAGGAGLGAVKPMAPLSSKEKLALPMESAGVPNIGSSQYTGNQLERLEEEKAHPWGSPDNHPGTLGKIGHVLGRIGNVAGDVLAPGIMEAIPGTDLNKRGEENSLKRELATRTAAEGQAANQKSEADLRGAQAENLRSEVSEREGKNEQSLEKDANGDVVGWRDKAGLHSMDEAPQSIKDIADEMKGAPRYETDKVTGNIVKLSTDKDGKTSSEVVYKGTPNQKTETRSIVGTDGHAHDKVFDMTPGANFGKEIADLGRAKEDKKESAAGEIAKSKADERVVLAYDKDNHAHLMSAADAKEEGMTHITAASSGDIDKAKTHHVVLNTLQTQLNSVVASSKALDQGFGQRAIIQSAISHPGDGAIDTAMRNAVLSQATEQTKEYVRSVLALREAGLALPKEITGGSRVSEVQASALWATMPSASSLNSDYALKQSKKFQQDIDRLRERAPEVRGQTMVDPDDSIKSKGTEKQHTTNAPGNFAPPPDGKVSVYDTKGAPHYVNADKVDKFLADPQYKGWSKNAPK